MLLKPERSEEQPYPHTPSKVWGCAGVCVGVVCVCVCFAGWQEVEAFDGHAPQMCRFCRRRLRWRAVSLLVWLLPLIKNTHKHTHEVNVHHYSPQVTLFFIFYKDGHFQPHSARVVPPFHFSVTGNRFWRRTLYIFVALVMQLMRCVCVFSGMPWTCCRVAGRLHLLCFSPPASSPAGHSAKRSLTPAPLCLPPSWDQTVNLAH